MNDAQSGYESSLHEARIAEWDKQFGYSQPIPQVPTPSTKPEDPKAEPPKKEEDGGMLAAVGSFIKELPEQALGGIFDAVNNTIEGARDIGEAVGIPNYALQITDAEGNFSPHFLNPEEVEAKGGLHPGIVPSMPPAETAAGGFTRAITKFAAGFIPVSRGLKAAGMAGGVTRGITAGAIADAVVADPHQARLSTLLNEVPVLQDIIPDYIADNNPDNESVWEGRIKNTLEGVVVGGASEVAIGAATKLFRAYKTAKNAPVVPKDAAGMIADDIGAAVAKATAFEEISPSTNDVGKMGPEELLTKTPKGKTYFNYSRVNTAKDVKTVMANFLDKAPDDGVMSLKSMKKASKAEYKNIADLMGRKVNTPFTPEQAIAARELLTASSENITELAKAASAPLATPSIMFEFAKAVEVHGAMQEVVIAGRKATARSLKSWDLGVGSNKARAKQIAEILEKKGSNTRQMARMLSDVSANGGNVSGVIGKTLSGKWSDAHYQVWINGLLSSPATHAANITSNLGTTLFSIPERYIAAGFEAMQGAGGSALVEANSRAAGFFGGLGDAFQLLRGKSENVALAAGTKIDRPVDAISAAAWGKAPDSTIGKGLDYLGKAIGMPGWALEKGDIFFKGLNYRMRVQEGAARQALEEGLKGRAFKHRVAELVQSPTEAMQEVGTDFARYQTFTNQSGPIAKSVSRLARVTPGGRYVIPFINTPANILSYGFERTPLALAMGKTREALKAGGARQAEAMARMSAGTLLMASVVPLALGGKVTGAGPSNVSQRKALEKTGWRPYSVKIGNKYISYDRIEPLSTLIGYSADLSTILGQVGEEEGGELVAAGLATFSKNLTNKTFLSGITEFVSTVTSDSPRKWEAYSQRFLAGMVQPVYSSAARKMNNYFDPVSRDYRPDSEAGYIKSLFLKAQENVPGLGTEAPPLNDVWGDEIRYDHGVAPALEAISPIRIYKEDKNPINKLVADNDIIISLPSRKIQGVELTNKEYHDYTKLAGANAKRMMTDAYDSGVFDHATGGPDGEKALIIKHIFSKARVAASRELIMDNPEVEDRIFNAKLERQAKLIGE